MRIPKTIWSSNPRGGAQGRMAGTHTVRRTTRRSISVALLLCCALAVPLAVAQRATSADAAGQATYSSIPMQSWRLDGVGRSILKAGNTIYVGGSFTQAISPDGTQRVDRRNFAAFDATTGALIPTFRADADNAIYNIQIDGDTLYVGGVFT
jgi:hypothetical protein